MRRTSLFERLFLAMSLSSLVAVVAAGVAARSALGTAFDRYLTRCGFGQGMGMSGLRAGSAEEEFMASLNLILVVAALGALALAIATAYFVARGIARPAQEIEEAALAIAEGDVEARVVPSGPTEFVSLGDSFNHMAESLQRSENLRSRMISDVAHELRNPIASLRVQLEGVVDGVVDATDERFESLLDDVVMLGVLVDDLRALSRAEEGATPLVREEFELSQLVLRELDRASRQALPGVEVAVGSPFEQVLVSADVVRVQEMLRNLLSNALRHTASGSIIVTVERVRDVVKVAVRDTGEGISDEDLPFVFERLYRSDSARAADTGGSGIGLAIVRALAAAHGGDVFATHTPGGGATVGFELPLG